MSRQVAFSEVAEINRLHAEVVQHCADSRSSLNQALASAWQAGRLLVATKARVRRTMGGGAWLLWVRENFRGTPRTAQRYMRLALTVSDVTFLRGMSLRQAYERLGVATEPKAPRGDAAVRALPAHLRLAQRLLVAVRPCRSLDRVSPEQREAYRRDLRALYEELRGLFETRPADSAHTCPFPRNAS